MPQSSSTRNKRDTRTPSHFAEFIVGKLADAVGSPRSRGQEEGSSVDTTPKRSLFRNMNQKEKIKFLTEQVASKDEEILRLNIVLNEKTEIINKRCKNCSGSEVRAVGEDREDATGQPVDDETENVGSEPEIIENRVKKVEKEIVELKDSVNTGFLELAKLIESNQAPSFRDIVSQQHQQQHQQQQQQQQQQ